MELQEFAVLNTANIMEKFDTYLQQINHNWSYNRNRRQH